MLTKRTNILFPQALWQRLQTLAKERETSAGELVREAVVRSYFTDKRNEIKSAVQHIKHIRQPVKGVKDYPRFIKELINSGRKV